MKQNKSCAVIGTGISGLAAAIRMHVKGYEVHVFESNEFAGGKLSAASQEGYRFDLGPSVFTMPEYVDELFEISGKNRADYFSYRQLDPVYSYFFEDGTKLVAPHGAKAFAEKVAPLTSDSVETIEQYMKHVEHVYDLTAEVFLQNSLHKFRNFLTKATLKGILNFGKIGAFETMHVANARRFKDKRLVQLFDRYATYNGSSPYLAPATLNVIPHVEIAKGAYFPEGGMNTITKSLLQLGRDLGITYHFNTPIVEIVHENKKVVGVRTQTETLLFECVVCNMDINKTYASLLKNVKVPNKILNQPKSSSGIIFYWGIKSQFPELGLHNILFAANYSEEFESIFAKKDIYHDPTIYLNITSKYVPNDAPEGCENWFSFINVPNNQGQDWDAYVEIAREAVFAKYKRMLGIDVRPLIETEIVLDPRVIESRTSSTFGAIYGNSSNNKFAAFLRHPNFSKEIKGLYFCGGSVHPGPSIPLCLLSAKIATNLV